jgi:hypothetical protein
VDPPDAVVSTHGTLALGVGSGICTGRQIALICVTSVSLAIVANLFAIDGSTLFASRAMGAHNVRLSTDEHVPDRRLSAGAGRR